MVDEDIIKSRQLKISISEGINDLPEVTLKSHDLTGNLEKDIDNIEVIKKIDFP